MRNSDRDIRALERKYSVELPPAFRGFYHATDPTEVDGTLGKPPHAPSASHHDARSLSSHARGVVTDKSLQRHFYDHGAEFGAKSAREYESIGTKLYGNPNVEAQVRPGGEVLLYDRSTNTFATYNPDGTLKTVFKSREGSKYWDDGGNRSQGQNIAPPAKPH